MLLNKLNWGYFSKYRSQLFGISIITIMIYHFCEHALDAPSALLRNIAKIYNFGIGSIGVEIFLFLSGMGLYFSMSKDDNVQRFYSKRFKRVLLPYVLWGAVFWIWKDLIIYKYPVSDLILDFTTLSFWLKGNKNLWYVAFILVLYLLFPLIHKALNDKKPHRSIISFLLIVISVAATIALHFTFPKVFDNIEVALFRIPVFILGTYYGKAVADNKPFSAGDVLLLIGGITGKLAIVFEKAVLGTDKFPSRLAQFLYSLLIMVLLILIIHKCFVANKAERILGFFGKYSFELYITHVTLRTIMNAYGFVTYNPINYIMCIALSVIISVILSKSANKALSMKKTG